MMNAEQAEQAGKGLLKAVAVGIVVLIFGAIAIQGFSGPEREVQAQGGLETTDRSCEFVELEGQVYFRCGDGFEGKVMPLDPTPAPEPIQ